MSNMHCIMCELHYINDFNRCCVSLSTIMIVVKPLQRSLSLFNSCQRSLSLIKSCQRSLSLFKSFQRSPSLFLVASTITIVVISCECVCACVRQWFHSLQFVVQAVVVQVLGYLCSWRLQVTLSTCRRVRTSMPTTRLSKLSWMMRKWLPDRLLFLALPKKP